MPLRRDVGYYAKPTDGDAKNTFLSNDSVPPTEDLDVVIVGAGFSGCNLLFKLRKLGFKVKLVEAGTDLGGVWHWNTYPGARVDSQYPIYGLSIPEVYSDWNWSEQYPGVDELQRYFAHVEKKLQLKKDCSFETRVRSADFDGSTDKWIITCANGKTFTSRFFITAIGFAAKRHIPDWKGLDTFEGTIHHSSFWPRELDVSGKKMAVIGQGATGVQIAQECAKEVKELTVFVRTPNIACPMQQAKISKEQSDKDNLNLAEVMKNRLTTEGGFVERSLSYGHDIHNEQEREELFKKLWKLGGFRMLIASYNNILTDADCNRHVYDFWARKTRARINDPKVKDILAPLEPPHHFGGKRPSLEQDYYDQFNKPNVHCVSIKNNPIVEIKPKGVVTADGVLHECDILALATGFDAVNGGLKDIQLTGLNGQTLDDKWSQQTLTYLGLSINDFPNFFFTYGAQAPTAFSNGPSSLEPQCDFIIRVITSMKESGKTRINPTKEKEREWYETVQTFSKMTLRHDVDSWYMGTNIPGKKKEALNYSGGLPLYIKTIDDVADKGFEGYTLTTVS